MKQDPSMEAAHEELTASKSNLLKEDLLAISDELRRVEEELAAAREEIRTGAQALVAVNSDLENLVHSSQIAALFLDEELRVWRFTPAAKQIYELRDTDIGRPIANLKPLAGSMPPLPRSEEVLRNGIIEQSIGTDSGKSWIRRTTRYRSPVEGRGGIVVTFTDISKFEVQSLALSEREQQLASLISSTAEGIYGLDTHGVCTFANNACARLLGYAGPHELMGQSMHGLIHHTRADGSPYPVEECRVHEAHHACGEVHIDEEVFWRADGTSFDVESWSYPQRRDGEVVGCVVTFLDVSERRRWERDLSDREAHLRRVIDNTLGFIGVLDTDGTLREANATALTAAGLPRDELIGKKFWDCSWWSYDERVARQLKQAVEKAASGENQRYDVVIRVAGGSHIAIDFMLAPVRDEAGRVTHLIPSAVDISKRIEVQEAYRQSLRAVEDNEARLAMALRAGGMAAWEWNPRETIWTEDLYQLLGLPPTQTASSEVFFERVHPDDRPRTQEAWGQAVAGHRLSFEQQFRIVRPDGEMRWLVGIGKVEKDAQGEVIRLLGLNWDSTESHLAAEKLRESERRAQQANLAKSAFIANMSHEIRTPMTAVLGYTELLAAKEDDAEKAEHLRTIKRNGKFLMEMINDILDLSKIEASKMEIDRRRFSPQEIFADVYSMMGERARRKKLDFALEYRTRIPAAIVSDPKRLKQILVNLVGNAIKFTERGSVILSVSFAAEPHPVLQFDVADTGIGMSEEQQKNLFQPFSQGDASVSRKFGGTGLGLAISRRLAKMLGGEIRFQSYLGQGSTFSCTVDAGDTLQSEMIKPTLDAISERQSTVISPQRLNCRILVVDDRRDVRYLTKHFLAKAGAVVELAEDGQQALEFIEQTNRDGSPEVDLILLDMQMPRLDGYETARKLRQMGFFKPIIALTADAMHGDMSRCIECGCDSYLSKPIDGPVLVAAVSDHLRTI